MDLPHNLIPEVTICQNGYQYSISNLKTNDLIRLVAVYYTAICTYAPNPGLIQFSYA